MPPTLPKLLLEAAVVGAALVALVVVLFMATPRTVPAPLVVFLAGFLFHVLAEYSGVNAWYCRNY